jgi:2-C-methyl-D-erythritol 4-phosphate cytidylyltransferase / 2-C-methyl-D-erythritol 2,4-cyclodiphosphate synthase
MSMVRTGFGYDIHRLVPQRKLVLGGVLIPSSVGLLGHSDADVLLHAICDALLGAAALGDIGRHFPDSDKEFKDVSSVTFLKKIRKLLEQNSFRVVNVDSTVVLEQPKIASFIPEMQHNIAEALGIQSGQISVKATTNEGLGAVGSGEGCAAYAVASLQSLEIRLGPGSHD